MFSELHQHKYLPNKSLFFPVFLLEKCICSLHFSVGKAFFIVILESKGFKECALKLPHRDQLHGSGTIQKVEYFMFHLHLALHFVLFCVKDFFLFLPIQA